MKGLALEREVVLSSCGAAEKIGGKEPSKMRNMLLLH